MARLFDLAENVKDIANVCVIGLINHSDSSLISTTRLDRIGLDRPHERTSPNSGARVRGQLTRRTISVMHQPGVCNLCVCAATDLLVAH